MNGIVIYKSKYGATKTYAEWIAQETGYELRDVKTVKIEDLADFDTIIYGGGLYAEVINGVSFITKNLHKLSGKRIFVFTTGLTPVDCRDYYDKMVAEKNFRGDIRDTIRVFNFPGKMIVKELSLVHKTAIKTLKKIMSEKENPTEMEKLLVELCDADGDFCDKNAIAPMLEEILN